MAADIRTSGPGVGNRDAHVSCTPTLSASISSTSRMGCCSSSRAQCCGPGSAVMSDSGPMKQRSEVTTASRKGSMAGLVT